MHIGHAKSICLNFGVAEEYGGMCNLRFDDTNPDRGRPSTSSPSRDVRWLGFDWAERPLRLGLLRAAVPVRRAAHQDGKAYVDSLTADEIRERAAR